VIPLPALTSEQADITARMAALASTRFAPRAARYDAESSFPYENYRDLHEAGLLGLAVPKRWPMRTRCASWPRAVRPPR
jgi:alkylation response protein AidB-like acyl-CoA dehydrogenase